jgi:hypothetical protein
MYSPTVSSFHFTSLPVAPKNPELMAEAQKMMDSPEFQKQMKTLQQSKEFKESIKKTTEKLKDPNQAAAAEAKLEHMVKVGSAELKKGARSAVEEAMASMANPEVMAEMAKMIKDPSFMRQLESMSKDPTFKNYIDAVRRAFADSASMDRLPALTLALSRILLFDLCRSDARHDEGPADEGAIPASHRSPQTTGLRSVAVEPCVGGVGRRSFRLANSEPTQSQYATFRITQDYGPTVESCARNRSIGQSVSH